MTQADSNSMNPLQGHLCQKNQILHDTQKMQDQEKKKEKKPQTLSLFKVGKIRF